MLATFARGGAVLAVLPFEELDAQPGQGYFVRGFVADLITALSRFPDLQVIAAHSAYRLLEEAADAPRPHLDYVLEGSMRREGTTIRLNVRLTEPLSARVCWSERFDCEGQELLSAQDDIVSRVVSALSDRTQAGRLSLARAKPLTELASYDYWLRGLDRLREGTPEADESARTLFERAAELDPSFARAHVGLSLSFFNEWSCQLWERWDDTERMAFEHADRALALDDTDHYAHMVMGRVLLYRREHALAEQHLERAVALNPNDAEVLVQVSVGFAMLGRADEGLELFERARHLNPYHPPWYHAYGCLVSFARGDFAGALASAERAPAHGMVDLPAHAAVCQLRLGEREAARASLEAYLNEFTSKIARGRAAEPGEALRFLQHVNPYRRAEDEARLLDGVRELSGLPQTPPPPSLSPSRERRAFRRLGSLWQLSYDGRDAHLPHVKGFGDIAVLLQRPGEAVHCAELMGIDEARGTGAAVIDRQARQAYQRRIAQLERALADAAADSPEARALSGELDALLEHLHGALGLGGRARRLGSGAERARSAVTWRIRSAIAKIAEVHPSAAAHFGEAIQTGTRCCYDPRPALSWQL